MQWKIISHITYFLYSKESRSFLLLEEGVLKELLSPDDQLLGRTQVEVVA